MHIPPQCKKYNFSNYTNVLYPTTPRAITKIYTLFHFIMKIYYEQQLVYYYTDSKSTSGSKRQRKKYSFSWHYALLHFPARGVAVFFCYYSCTAYISPGRLQLSYGKHCESVRQNHINCSLFSFAYIPKITKLRLKNK